MKKHFYLFLAMLMVVMSLSLTACGDDNDEPSGDNSFVGTWSVEYWEGWRDVLPPEAFQATQYIQFRANGTFTIVQIDEGIVNISSGNWSSSQHKLNIQYTAGEAKGLSFTYDIIKTEKNKITLSILGVKGYFVRIDDSVINQYLN